ncbi:prenyltransferase [Kitasatospora sp. MMS16-BH015]|uniref:prenyltransferase/squalene oxidase repeat-containing protein n=1 Tax=Kitasatospora sp. MMS16-BH015 TaxID=2018025 RepID=UPI000CA38553|nr:prenyltransferase/squalene oxidase repeat-containing protein [Kitasatospora sp. MMS16-BH015]AUG80715.1 prenyltransferase [Kitasatospora sp. MMS16-BH015]
MSISPPLTAAAPARGRRAERWRRCLDRLAERVGGRVGADGLVSAPCESRVLESALLLHLLTVEEAHPAARERLTRYLKTTLDLTPPDAVQTAAARAALGEAVPGDAYAVRALGGPAVPAQTKDPAGGRESWSLDSFDHFTADRKRVMFRTLLAELGAVDHHPTPPGLFASGGQQSWLQLEMTALKVLARHGAAPGGSAGAGGLSEAELAALAPALRPGPVWEGNHLARLVGLAALRKHPAQRQAVRAALDRVVTDLRPDGGLPFVTGLDVFATAIAGLALAGSTRPAGLLARMGEGLAARQHPDGGFGFTRGVDQSDVDDTSYAVEFLRALTAVPAASHPDGALTVPPSRTPTPAAKPTPAARSRLTAPLTAPLTAALAAAEQYLLAQQNPDGGMPTFARGCPSETAMTAAAVNALAPEPRHRAAVDRALGFLAGQAESQATSALLERSWSRNVTNVVFRAVLACEAAAEPGEYRGLRRRLLSHLARGQNEDGGWGHQAGDPSDPISSAYAAIALSRSPSRADRLARCLDYLADCQLPCGGYRSRPDQAGPRPLLYDVPVLAEVCVLLALAHALGPEPR